MRVAVLGDIHANVRALRAALDVVDYSGYDQLIFIGDLLTYGIDVIETLELIEQHLATGRAALLRGNHDALYRDMLSGSSSYYEQLPIWIRESVDLTLGQLTIDLWSEFVFQDEIQIHNTLFSHANPFGPEKWGYLNSEVEHADAARELGVRGLRNGIFGHTHRAKWYRHREANGYFKADKFGDLDFSSINILNSGAIGQPRDVNELSSFVLWLNFPNDSLVAPSFKFERFPWDVSGYLRGLESSKLSRDTVKKLSSFFKKSF